MLLLFADGIFLLLIAPFLVVLAVPAVFFVFRDIKGDRSPPSWAAAITLAAAIWLLAVFVGAKLTLFGNYAVTPLLIGIPLTYAVAIKGDYEFNERAQALTLLLGPIGSVAMLWSPIGEMAGLEIIRNLRPFGMPEPGPRRRKR